VNGQLAVFDASKLVPGSYYLRLSVSQNDRTMGDPYVVSIRVGGVEAVELPETPVDETGRVVEASKIVNPPPAEQPTPSSEQNGQEEGGCTSLQGCP
jgi:hypothetical protein